MNGCRLQFGTCDIVSLPSWSKEIIETIFVQLLESFDLLSRLPTNLFFTGVVFSSQRHDRVQAILDPYSFMHRLVFVPSLSSQNWLTIGFLVYCRKRFKVIAYGCLFIYFELGGGVSSLLSSIEIHRERSRVINSKYGEDFDLERLLLGNLLQILAQGETKEPIIGTSILCALLLSRWSGLKELRRLLTS